MSIVTPHTHPQRTLRFPSSTRAPSTGELIASVQQWVAPVWPLQDTVAVNPYEGLRDQKFLLAREQLRAIADYETLMSSEYYRRQFQAGQFGLAELRQAIDEMVADNIPDAETLNANRIYQWLDGRDGPQETVPNCSFRAFTDQADRATHGNWTEAVRDEISKHCSGHYDMGQATWRSPYRDLPLYPAWRAAAKHDRRIEILGLKHFRKFVADLPTTPEVAISALLRRSGIPTERWFEYLACLALSLPGWSAWTKHQSLQTAKQGSESPEFAGLLAIRLAYDVALAEQFGLDASGIIAGTRAKLSEWVPSTETLSRLAMLRALEIGIRTRILESIHVQAASDRASRRNTETTRQLAQLVFCIDVRSERIRRNLENSCSAIETIGFAGFFGLPFEYVRLGDDQGTNQLPALLDPKFQVFESLHGEEQHQGHDCAVAKRAQIRGLRHYWKSFQTSALSCFGFVETAGLLFASKIVHRLLGRPLATAAADGVHDPSQLRPSLRDLEHQGVTTSQQVDLAEGILRGTGLTQQFARFVVLCGHTASTENNPQQASLECGACGGHSGESNARLGAMLLNEPAVRRGLLDRGIDIPEETRFLAAVHNTTTDDVTCFDTKALAADDLGHFAELQHHLARASALTRTERAQTTFGSDAVSLIGRSHDWSEVRPEWGLTGNAAMIVGPRKLTQNSDLEGRSFLHSYDYRQDPDGKQLEQILTAPLVVANWINLQYYASTVDPQHFGSGNKTIHNVVGKFGILAGNGGDLKTGLSWESIHNGVDYQHAPVRLLTVVESPRSIIERILAKHENVRQLVMNGWLNLVVLDGCEFYRYTERGTWSCIPVGLSSIASRHTDNLVHCLEAQT